jgi:hypothetical protein
MLGGVIKTISCSLFLQSTKKEYSVLENINMSCFLHPWLMLERAVASGEDVCLLLLEAPSISPFQNVGDVCQFLQL